MNEFLLILFHIDTYNVCEFAGSLHWKIVSVYINRMGQVITSFFFLILSFVQCAGCCSYLKLMLLLQVMLKMKSRHVAGTITKKKKSEF